MKTQLTRWFGALTLLAATLLSLTVAPGASAASQPGVTPAVGGPYTRFTFFADGFKGDPKEGDEDTVNDAEVVSFWINTPAGYSIQAIQDGAEKASKDASSQRATREGTTTWYWRAPQDIPSGAYTLVAYGNQTGHTVTIPFNIDGNARGVLINAPYSVTPTAGAAGARFHFVITGFNGDLDDGDNDKSNDAEKVAFWINTPDGQTIRAIRAGIDKDDKDAPKATVAQANRAGTVEWAWQAPANAAPGTYTLVAHGLQSEREQVIAFQIQ
jgi:hypothetical protein